MVTQISYHDKEDILLIIDPYSGNSKNPDTDPRAPRPNARSAENPCAGGAVSKRRPLVPQLGVSENRGP